MLESLRKIVGEVGKQELTNPGNKADPDKRLDVRNRPDEFKMQETRWDPNKRIDFNYDDNGKAYRVGDNLLPNNEYERNGYEFKTDNHGRIISAEGNLQQKDHEGRYNMPDSLEKVGKGDERKTDDRGHLIPDQFNGPGGLENLTAQDKNLNRKDIANLENTFSKALETGKEVYLKIDVEYDRDSNRPSGYTYTYRIDGEVGMKTFLNEGAGR